MIPYCMCLSISRFKNVKSSQSESRIQKLCNLIGWHILSETWHSQNLELKHWLSSQIEWINYFYKHFLSNYFCFDFTGKRLNKPFTILICRCNNRRREFMLCPLHLVKHYCNSQKKMHFLGTKTLIDIIVHEGVAPNMIFHINNHESQKTAITDSL